MTFGSLNVFTRMAVIDENLIGKGLTICQPIILVDAKQLNSHSIRQKTTCRHSKLDIMELVALRIWSCSLLDVKN